MEFDAMPRDAEIVADVLRDKGISIDQLADRAGYDNKTIYRYLTGERTIPSIVLRAAFELSIDGRIVRLITGAIPVCLHLPPNVKRETSEQINPLKDTLADTFDAIESTAKVGRYIHDTLSDSTVDATDLPALEKLVTEGTRAQESLSRTVASANAEINRIRGASAAGPKGGAR